MEKPYQIYNRRRKIYWAISVMDPVGTKSLNGRVADIRSMFNLEPDENEVRLIANKVKKCRRLLRFNKSARTYIGAKCKQ